MSSEFLSSYIGNAESRVKRTTATLLKAPNCEVASENSFYHRQKGTCDFLRTGQVGTFFDCMHKSAGSYLYFLIEGNDVDKQTSDNNAFFDAVIAGLWECTKLMAQHARGTCNFDYEYEDDFLYNHFLLTYFFKKEKNKNDVCTQILADYKKVLNGESDVRFLLCKAFFERNTDDFTECFEQFLIERAGNIERMIEREVMGEEVWSWARYVSNEGLALLKLAEVLGFELDSHYSQIPEILRVHPDVDFNPNLWKEAAKSDQLSVGIS